MTIEFPEAQSTATLLKALEQGSAKVVAELEQSQAKSEEIASVKEQSESFEDEITEARSRIFILLREKLRDREAARADAYGARLEQALQAFAPPKATP